MNEHVDDLISAYIDHELSDQEKELVEEHLHTCSQCQALLNDLTSLQQLVFSNYQALETSDSFEDLIMQKIQLDSQAKKTRNGYGKLLFILSVAAAIMLLLPGLYFGGIITTVLHITINLMSLVPIFISSIPMLMVGIMLFAFVLVLLSIWSLRSLLGGGWIEKRTT